MYSALLAIKNRLNEHLKNAAELSEDIAVLGLPNDATENTQANRIVLTVANIQREQSAGKNTARYISADNHVLSKYPPLHLNIYILASADFGSSNYEESLKFMSMVMKFFQANPVFSHHTVPELDSNIDKLTIEMVDTDFHELSQIWGMAGGKYLPSVVYKIRMISLSVDDIAQESKLISEPETSANHL